MNFFWLLIGVLCVWRITHLFQAEDGPWDLIVKFRSFLGNGFFGNLLDCFYCLSLWIALPFSWWLADAWQHRLLLWPALSAGAIIVERLTSRSHEALYFEEEPEDIAVEPEKEKNDVMLR